MLSAMRLQSWRFPGSTRRASSSAFPLPSEIIDQIIDFLFDDVPALARCSLVCRAWTPACRYHLHKYVGVNWIDIDTMTTMFAPNSGIAPYVQELSLYESPPTLYNPTKHSSWLSRHLLIPYQLSRLRIRADLFRSLTHLTLSYRWNRSPNMQALIRQLLPKVEVLCFTKYFFENEGIELISLADNLRELKMHEIIKFPRRVVRERETSTSRVPSGLHTLRCDSYSELGNLLAWISHSPNISSLHTLELYPSGQFHAPALSALVGKLGTGLRHLILSIWSFELDPWKDSIIHGASFAGSTGIETITFRRSRLNTHHIIADALRMIPIASLRRVIVQHVNESSSFVGNDLLELLNDPLGNYSIRRVILQFNKVALDSSVHAQLREKYQPLELQKRLEFGRAL